MGTAPDPPVSKPNPVPEPVVTEKKYEEKPEWVPLLPKKETEEKPFTGHFAANTESKKGGHDRATKKRIEPESSKPEYQRDGEGWTPPEAGGSGGDE